MWRLGAHAWRWRGCFLDCPQGVQGSRYIAFRFLEGSLLRPQVYFDHVDNLKSAPADINKVQELIFSHFDIEDRSLLRGQLLIIGWWWFCSMFSCNSTWVYVTHPKYRSLLSFVYSHHRSSFNLLAKLNKKERLFVTDSAFSHTATTNSVKQSSQAYPKKSLKQLLKVDWSGGKTIV